MYDTGANLTRLRQRIATAAKAVNRNPSEITLVAVSKTQPLRKIHAAITAGQREFGENYLQEAVEKIKATQGEGLVWHFIGPIQSNKTRDIAAHFDWVHSVGRFKIAHRLSAQRPSNLPPLNVCLQVNISSESSKSGIAPAEAVDLACRIHDLPNLQLRGLMAVPAPASTFAAQRQPFARLRELQATLNSNGCKLDSLSMGMTDDLEAAIAEGTTMVRVGTAIFGPRQLVKH